MNRYIEFKFARAAWKDTLIVLKARLVLVRNSAQVEYAVDARHYKSSMAQTGSSRYQARPRAIQSLTSLRRSPQAWGKPAPKGATDISQGREITPEWGLKNEASAHAYPAIQSAQRSPHSAAGE
jgi:hypothetical protein